MSDVNEKRDPFVGQFASLQPLDAASDWIAERRSDSEGALESLRLPGPKEEAWRFVKLRPLANSTFAEAETADVDAEALQPYVVDEAEAARVVFVNGAYAPDLSDVSGLPEGVIAASAGDLDEATSGVVRDTLGQIVDFYEDDPFVGINDAQMNDVGCVVVPPETSVETPIHLLHLNVPGSDAHATHPRVVIVGGRGSKVTVVEDYAGLEEGAYFNNVVTEVTVAENARVEHVRLQRDAEPAFNFSRVGVRLAKAAHYDSVSVTFGARLSRTDTYVVHEGSDAFARIDGLALIGGRQETDTHTFIDNTKPRAQSHQLHKCIVDGKGHAVFNGIIYVREGAQKINAYQLNRNLLLSNGAKVDTKPQLEIFADDVECTHGATIGQLDEDQQFYLVSRGVAPERARSILTYAFAAEVIDAIHVPSLRDRLEAEAFELTQNASGGGPA